MSESWASIPAWAGCLVPAVMSPLGDKAWWLPRWLDKAMPNVDIEGESLRTGQAADS